MAELLAGDYSPAGRLPVTFYRNLYDLPAFTDYSMENRTYKYHKGEVLYPFGHGLSYTSFAYSNAGAAVNANGTVTVTVDVANTGAVDSDEVVQLYLSRPDLPDQPIRVLAGFDRVNLAKGERRTVTFTLDDRALSTVDAQGARAVHPGKVDFWVGGGQPVSRPGLKAAPGASGSFALAGAARVLPK